MKVILQQDVRGQGKRGQMIEVAEGYARNFLLPKKLAVLATADAMNKMKMQEKARRAEEEAQKAKAIEISKQLGNCVVKLNAKGGTAGRLFGAITAKEISEALLQQFDIEIAKQKLVLEEPIKSFGTYEIKAKLGFEIYGKIYVVVAEEK